MAKKYLMMPRLHDRNEMRSEKDKKWSQSSLLQSCHSPFSHTKKLARGSYWGLGQLLLHHSATLLLFCGNSKTRPE